MQSGTAKISSLKKENERDLKYLIVFTAQESIFLF